MLSARKVLIGLPLVVISGIAAQLVFGTKVSGDMVSATWNGPAGFIDLVPVDTDDARAYQVSWQWCTPESTPGQNTCTFASGLAPRSAIKTQQVDTIGIDLDISMLSVVYESRVCNSTGCQPIPDSVPLHGTFTIYQGPGSSVEQTQGSTRRDTRVAAYPSGIFLFSNAFTGSQTKYSANFAGTVGPVKVDAVLNGSNGFVTIMKGQQTFQTIYPSAP